MALRSRVLAAVAAALPLAMAAGCSGGIAQGEASAAQASPGASIPAGPANGPQSLSETGSTLLFPVLRTWASAYRQQHANVSIATAATGSGKGIAEASAGAVDIGASDAYLSSGDLVTKPDTSSHHLAAQVAAVRIQVSPHPGQAQVSPGDLGEAGARVDRLKLDAIQMEYLTAEVLRAGLGCAQAGGAVSGGRLLGCEFTERGLRFGLERSYRAQARLAPDRRRRIELVEAANSVRPRTWV